MICSLKDFNNFHFTKLTYIILLFLVFFSSDLDCGGGYCDLSPNSQGNCACNCGDNSCLQIIAGQDVGCELKCICGAACSSTIFNETGATCDNTACEDCSTTNTTCPDDTDCIINDGQTDGKCVDSGLCTSAKKDLCDLAYASVSGSTNKRAKCCPATSGCIRSRIGVIATSSCSTNCGSCLGGEEAPGGGNKKNEHPETFCKFGQRLGEI